MFTGLDSLSVAQLSKMIEKGDTCSERVRASALSPEDAWHRFRTHTIPSVCYGTVSLIASPDRLEREFVENS